MRFGHAFPNPRDPRAPDPVLELCQLLDGSTPIGPREPVRADVVSGAERILDIQPDNRPVYAYVGSLHPELGRVGLILRGDWFDRNPHGTTRCDSGGLAGRCAAFSVLSEAEAEEALLQLSFRAADPWEPALQMEVAAAFGSYRAYLEGRAPADASLHDVRDRCIRDARASGLELDRRVWTWEARSFSAVELRDVTTVVLTPEAFKEVTEYLRSRGMGPPGARVIEGHVDPAGVHYFQEQQVVEAFMEAP